jgi:hypothetical protein
MLHNVMIKFDAMKRNITLLNDQNQFISDISSIYYN